MSYGFRSKRNSGRGLVSTMSYLIRQFVLPNPFENIFPNPGSAEVVNWIFGGIFIPLAFLLTGTWYVSGCDEKWIGSLGFLVNYCLLTGLLLLISKFISNMYWVVGIFIFLYIILCFLEGWLLNRRNNRF